MDQGQSFVIKARGSTVSIIAMVRIIFLSYASWLAFGLLTILLEHLFPVLSDCLQLLSIIWVFCFLLNLLLLLLVSCCYTVWIDPEGITTRLFGIPLRRIPQSDLRLFCTCGNGREDILCLSTLSMEELAHREEKRLLGNWLTRPDVPFRKQKAGWQEAFANEHLLHLRRNPFHLLFSRQTVMLPMDPVLQILIRRRYPELPYRNISPTRSRYLSFSQLFYGKEDQAFSLALQLHDYSLALEENGISIRTPKGQAAFLPTDRIKALLRVDAFWRYRKYRPNHLPLLFISSLSVEELAGRAPKRIYGLDREELSESPDLLALAAASKLATTWQLRKKEYCVMYCTEKNFHSFCALYPNVPFFSLSERWIQDSSEE